jgi:hypothetical protein
LLIAYAGSSGSFSIGEWPMQSEALPSTKDHDSNAPKECFENCAS